MELFDVTSNFIVTTDSNNKPAEFFHTGSDSVLNFWQWRKGLYYFDTYAPNVLNPFFSTYSFLSTVQENKKIFQGAKIEGTDADIILQHNSVLTSSTKFKRISKGNWLQSLPIIVAGIDKDDTIYGPQVFTLKGKFVRKRLGNVENIPRVLLPLPTEKEYNNISILMDYTFINVWPFLLTRSVKMNFHSIQACMGRVKLELKKGPYMVKKTYKDRGLNITKYHGDSKFLKKDHISFFPH